MDISSRNVNPSAPGLNRNTGGGSPEGRRKSIDNNKWGRVGLVAAVAALAVLLGAIIALGISNNSDNNVNTKSEASYVDNSKLQAVFLNTGQVYFGHIKALNSKYVTLTNIYYLQTSGNNANPNVTLVKLGCELHEPDDLMVINRDQVTFWENLHDSGQVAKAVADFQKKNPDGQKCVDQSTSSSTNSTKATQNANNGSPANANATTNNTNQ